MGIPKFNRFITNRYPGVQEEIKDGMILEVDNFFVDMNGIIHLCTHPGEGIPEEDYTTQNMYENIFNFVDVLFDIVKPKKLLFLAIDGVAPRAKLNQQRARRFKSGKERQFYTARSYMNTPPPFSRFDANCITPGTKFMERLQKYLEYFISLRISTSPSWRNCKVILCGSKVPGEGEHKIMEYIRELKMDPDYNPYEKHCVYGLDADLMILSLCTKEKNIFILREGAHPNGKAIRILRPEKKNFSMIHLSLLREYLNMEFKELKRRLKFMYSLERIIDDWVLMGFLIGNDYLPHLADFHIERGAIQILYRTYIEVLPTLTGYINENGYLNLQRFKVFMKKLSQNIKKNFRMRNHPYFDDKRDLPRRTNQNMSLVFVQYRKEYYQKKLKFSRKNFAKKCRNLAKEYVRGLQWILHYYYHGCRSWSWFYPEYYGPCASTIIDIDDVNLDFVMGRPFLPYEQLLAVLPRASKNFLPRCYRKLMTSGESAVKKYYPKQFETDLNGKKNEWEAVALLPMIREKELLSAMKPLRDSLKTWQKQNNTHGHALVFSYTEARQASVSTPKYFPEITRNHAYVEPIVLRRNPAHICRIVYSSERYYVQPDTYFPGFPSFRNINFKSEKIIWEVGVNDGTIKIEKLIVNIVEHETLWNTEMAMKLLGKTVYVNWPNLTEARIVWVEDVKNKYLQDGKIIEKLKLGEQAKFNWIRTCTSLRNSFLERGVEIGNTRAIVHVHCLKGIRRHFDSSGGISIEKAWSEKTYTFPLQTIVRNLFIHESHRGEPILVGDMFPPEAEIFSLEYSTYGCKGRIKKKQNNLNDELFVTLDIVDDRKIKKEIAKYKEPRYYSHFAVGKKLRVSPAIVGKIAGSILVSLESEDSETTQQTTLNIGLQIQNSESNEKVPGYTKQKDNWMYSDQAVTVMQQYIRKFPKVVDFLLAQSVKETSATKSDIILGFDDFEAFKEIVQWVQSLECSRIERVSCDSQIVEEKFIERLKKILDSSPCEVKSQKLQYMQPQDLFTNNLIIGDIAPVATTRYELFDCIACITRKDIVPFGTRGYIIGIIKIAGEEEMYEILFEKSLANDSNSDSPLVRKVRMSKAQFLNITRGKKDLAPDKEEINPNSLKAYRQIFQSKLSSMRSMLAEKLRIGDWKLMRGHNELEEASSTVSNSSIKQVQEKVWASYRNHICNPCILASPSLQLLRLYDDGNRYMFRNIQINDSGSNIQHSNPYRQDNTGKKNKLFGGRIFSVFSNLFPIQRQTFRSGAPVDPDAYPSLQDNHNVMADNDQPGTSRQVVATTGPNFMPAQAFFRNFKKQEKKEGQASEDVVHPSVSATESH